MNRLALLVLCLFVAGCSGSNPAAPTTTPPVTTPAPVVETTYTVSGKITVGVSTTPIAGATVTAGGARNAGKTATTDGNGNYTITGLFFEGFGFTFTAPGYLPATQSVILTAGTTSRTFNASLLPTVLWSKTGSGNQVFDMPTYFARVAVHGDWTRRDNSNFIVYLAGRLLVNEILRTSITYDSSYLTNGGGIVQIMDSGAINWTFTEIR